MHSLECNDFGDLYVLARWMDHSSAFSEFWENWKLSIHSIFQNLENQFFINLKINFQKNWKKQMNEGPCYFSANILSSKVC